MLEVDDYIFDSTPDNKVCYKVTYVSEFFIEAIGYFFESRTIETKTLMLDENGNHYLPNGSIIKANEESAKALDRIIKMAGIHDPKELKKEIQEIISLSNSFCHETKEVLLSAAKKRMLDTSSLDAANDPCFTYTVH